MRRKLREMAAQRNRRILLVGAVCLLALLCSTIKANPEHCTRCSHAFDVVTPPPAAGEYAPAEDHDLPAFAVTGEEEPVVEERPAWESEKLPLAEGSGPGFDDLWADVSGTVTGPAPSPAPSTERISLNVKEANLLDVLSMLAYKLDGNVIFLEEPALITVRTENLSALTTFEILLQKESLDYLVAGRNFIVGDRERLYEDFFNRMFLARFSLYFISADLMADLITKEQGGGDDSGGLGIPVEIVTVSNNQKALWMQGTPMALGKAREAINSLDVMENAAFGFGGARKIRMPVASASGPRATEELEALIDFLSILLDGYRDGRVAYGWAIWDHPDPVPSIFMNWESPVIKPYDIKMKITRDFAGDMDNQVRYLVAEGTPDNISLVRLMIETISATPEVPFPFVDLPDPDDDFLTGLDTEAAAASGSAVTVPQQNPAQSSTDRPQPVAERSLSLSLFSVPSEGGSLTGAGSYKRGDVVNVEASPLVGYEFVAWVENGAELSRSPVYSFYIYDSRSIEGVFKITSILNDVDGFDD